MTRVYLFAFVLAICLFSSSPFAEPWCSNPRDFTTKDRIVGGRPAILANWPGQAVLRIKYPSAPAYVCGGTLIQPDMVLTAAHCVTGLSRQASGWTTASGESVEVVLGTDDLRGVRSGQVHQIAEIISHEAYVGEERGNDIALIRLSRAATEISARLSLAPQSDPATASVTPLMVAGFGVQYDGGGLRVFSARDNSTFKAGAMSLLETAVPLTDAQACKAVYGNRFGDQQICAGFVEGGKDSCQGDSGGPLVAFDRNGCPYQVGIVSWGAGCARANAYGVYTRISSHALWIKKNAASIRAVDLEDVNLPTSPQGELVESTFLQLRSELEGVTGQAALAIAAGTKLRLGDTAVFQISSGVVGYPIIVDINSRGEVAQIFPNQFSGVIQIGPGKDLAIPDSPTYRFPVQEPVGRGKLVAIVVPQQFNMQALDRAKATRGFAVEAALPYLQNLINLIRIARAQDKGIGVEATGSAAVVRSPGPSPEWGLAELDYEVVR